MEIKTPVLVKEYMSKNVVWVKEDDSLHDVIELMRKHNIRHLPVVQSDGSENGGVVGIISDRDVKRVSPSLLTGVDQEEYNHLLNQTKTGRIMTRSPVTASPNTTLKDVATLMISKKLGALPIIENNRLVGMITQIDLIRALCDYI